jgi:glutathione S-transferase
MELDGTALTESMAMVELLEEIAPSPPLNYSTPLARAQVREACEAVNSSIHPVQNSSVVRHFRPDLSKNEMRPIRANWIASNLDKLKVRLWQSSSFAVGQQFTFADIFVAAIFRKGLELGIQRGALSSFETHWSFLMSHPTIRASCPLPEARAPHAKDAPTREAGSL